MKRLLTILFVLFILSSPSAMGEEITGRMVEDYRQSTRTLRPPPAETHASHQPSVSLLLDEDYSGIGKVAQPKEAQRPRVSPGSFLTFAQKIFHKTRLFSLIFVFVLLLIAAHFYLKFRIKASLSKIPWEGVRDDPRVAQWPAQNLVRKFRLWRYLRHLPQLEALSLKQHDQRRFQKVKNQRLSRFYAQSLKKTTRVDEARFLLGALSLVGNADTVDPALNLLQKFPDDADLIHDVVNTLSHIREAKVLNEILSVVPEADAEGFDILVRICKSFGEPGVDLIVRELRHQKDHAIRNGIIQVLGEIGGERIIPVLERLVFQGADGERMAAADALARIGTENTVDPLVHGLCHNTSSKVRDAIAQSLTKVPRELAIHELNKIVETSTKHYFQVRAIQGLETLKPQPSTVLRQALWNPHPKVQAAAAASLTRMGVVKEELDHYLEQFDEERQEFLVSVGRAGMLEPFIDMLKTDNSKLLKRDIRLLGRIGNQRVIPELTKLLEETDDWTVQSRLIPTLAALKATGAVHLVVEKLNSSHHWVRRTAIDALGRLLTPESSLKRKTLPLLHDALNDENPWARASAVRVLTTLEDRSCISKFTDLLKDPQTRVRVEAIRGLKWFHAMEAQDELLTMLDDPRQKVCAMAASAFGQFKSRRALPKLFERFENGRPLLRLAIMEAIYHIDPIELDPLLRYLKSADKCNLKVVSDLKDIVSFNPAEIFFTLARNADTEIRCQAIRNLGVLEHTDAEKFLVPLLKDPEASIRAAAVDAIAMTGSRSIIQDINEMRNDPDMDVRLRVILAMGLLKSPTILPYLRNSLYDADPQIRAHALMALFQYAEPNFLEFFLEQFREVKVRNILKKMITDRKDLVMAQLIEQMPKTKEAEFKILKNHTLKSLDLYLEEQILSGDSKELKLRACMIVEILKRKKVKKALRKAIQDDPNAEVRARALRAYSEISQLSHEKELIQKAIQDPALEVQTIATRLLIHLEEEEVV